MAITNITTYSNVLQTVFDKGFHVQISRDVRDWELIKRHKKDDRMARDHKFDLMGDIGIASVQTRNPGTWTSFPTRVNEDEAEGTAQFKEMAATVEIAQNLYQRAILAKDAKYGDLLATRIENAMVGMKRVASLQLHGDGTGVIGEVGATAQAVNASGTAYVDFYLKTASESDTARGGIGFFQKHDRLVLKAADGTASAFDSNLGTEPVYWKVISIDRENDKVTLQGESAIGTATANITSISTDAAAGEVFYRYAQDQIPDLSGSITDYGTETDVMPGLESLTATDGRTVHGITLSGAYAGTRYSAGGSALSSAHLESVMNDLKISVGGSSYTWKMALCSPEARSALIKSAVNDQRFSNEKDAKRGFNKFIYQHEESSVELLSSEFAKKNRIYVLPENKAGDSTVMEYWGTDFTPVADGSGNTLMLKPGSSGGHQNALVSYMQGYGTLICKRPAAIGVVTNFLVS